MPSEMAIVRESLKGIESRPSGVSAGGSDGSYSSLE
jgi:hypothetical protein